MKTPLLPRRQHLRRNRGFALIVTLTLMILLTIIALGLLSLSNVTLRQSTQESALSTARSNARMALMQAIGELQTNVGADTRVTARADILDANNPMILGAWKSWEGKDHDETTGRPIAPSYSDKKKSADSGGRFLRWLVSGNPDQLKEVGNLPDGNEGKDRITLIGEHTLAENADTNLQIHLDPVYINNSSGKPTGAYAWWVGGENQKALLPEPEKESSQVSNAKSADQLKSSTIADTKPFGLESLRSDPTLATKVLTRKQSDFLTQSGGSKVSREYFYDLGYSSVGLLTNTATGGWRKDMSLFTENFEKIPTSDLPVFRLTPDGSGADFRAAKATSSQPTAAKSLLYPWSSYRTGTLPYDKAGAVASWANLTDYALMYKKLGSGNAFSLSATLPKNLDNTYTYLHTIKPMLVVARIHWVLAYTLSNTDTITNPADRQDRITLKLTPVVTLWNPYNVTLNTTKLVITISSDSTFPIGLNYEVVYSDGVKVGGTYRSLYENGTYPSIQVAAGEAATEKKQQQFFIDNVGNVGPGQTKVYSVINSGTSTLGSRTLPLGPGFNSNYGQFLQLSVPGGTGQIYSPRARRGTDRAIAVNTKVILNNAIAAGPNAGKFGLKIMVRDDSDVTTGTTDRHKPDGKEAIYEMIAPMSAANGSEITLRKVDLPYTGANPSGITQAFPFMAMTFGLRMLDNLNEPGDAHDTNKLGKAFTQSSPLAGSSNLSLYSASGNRVNAAYDVNIFGTPAVGSSVPTESGAEAKGFLGTGFTIDTGITRLIAADLPVKPLASLGELQGWDMRAGNPAPPFAFNVIGNSDASPIFAASAIDAGDSSASNLQHDDSYCANHLLFDDWFFSSINEGNADQFGGGGSLKNNYTNFLKGTTKLVNASYIPVAEDAARADSEADTVYSENLEPTDAWRKIASHLEVKGMFNVNSTSVTAWKALLGHARGLQVPQYNNAGSITLNSKTDYAVSRYPVAGDVKADSSQGVAGEGKGDAAQYTGYHVFTESIIDELAEKIVDQVRKRGPFLSLSEFVNRQLSNDNDLAMAGAIQTALNEMESSVNGGLSNSAAKTNGGTGVGYKFADAAVGSSAYGMPGWVRQADVLRPLAPILSARDDTFTIRSYGDARDSNNKIIATAYCEATVRRTRNYCDPTDAADLAEVPTVDTNKTFGRKFEIVSFRWLSKSEI